MSEFIDGHRWPTTTPAVAPAERLPSATSDQVALGSVPADFPTFDVRPEYFTRRVAVLFDIDDIDAVCRHPLFAAHAASLHEAAGWIEDENDRDERDRRMRDVLGGVGL